MEVQDDVLDVRPLGMTDGGRLRFGVRTLEHPGEVAEVTVPANVPSPEMFADVIAHAHLAELDWKPVPNPRASD